MKNRCLFLLLLAVVCVLFCGCSLSKQEKSERQSQNSKVQNDDLSETLEDQEDQTIDASQSKEHDSMEGQTGATENVGGTELPMDKAQSTSSGEKEEDETHDQQGSLTPDAPEKNPEENDGVEKEPQPESPKDTVIELPIIPVYR